MDISLLPTRELKDITDLNIGGLIDRKSVRKRPIDNVSGYL
jgi:hypothetical protein